MEFYYLLLKELNKKKILKQKFFAGGSHFFKSHGSTYKEILDAKIKINDKFPFKFNLDDEKNLIKNIIFSNKKLKFIFENNKFDYICLLGDRIELISIAIFSLIYRIQLLHIGGEKKL